MSDTPTLRAGQHIDSISSQDFFGSLTTTRLKILVVCGKTNEADLLRIAIEDLNHRVLTCSTVNEAARWLREWQPDLLVTDESLGSGELYSGLRLAELCRLGAESGQGYGYTRALIVVPDPDWSRVKNARQTGAHVIVKNLGLFPIVRYVQTIADNLTTDRNLGPVLFGMHQLRGQVPERLCKRCNWIGASVSYGTSQTDLGLTPVRSSLLNALFFHRRGQTAGSIETLVTETPFLRSLLKGRKMRESAIKMEICRLRGDIQDGLQKIGAPYGGHHFLPYVAHSVATYQLAGNWQLAHITEPPAE